MDLVKKEAPISTADQTLIKETGGEHGKDNLGHIDATREAIAGNLNEPVEKIIPEDELAEKGLAEAEKAGFLKNVVGVQEEGNPKQSETPGSSLDLNKLGEHLNAFSPIGEDNDRGMPSTEPNEIELKRQKKRGVVK